jgi:hypothetical protein
MRVRTGVVLVVIGLLVSAALASVIEWLVPLIVTAVCGWAFADWHSTRAQRASLERQRH